MKIERLIQRYDIFDTKKLNENTVEYYSHVVTRLPKPFKDREMLAINRRREEKDSMLTISFSATHPNFPVNKKYVRMENHRTDVLIRRTADDQTAVSIFTSLDLKGNFPKWMMKMLSGSFIKSARNAKRYIDQLMRLKNEGVENPESHVINMKSSVIVPISLVDEDMMSSGAEDTLMLKEFLEMNHVKYTEH